MAIHMQCHIKMIFLYFFFGEMNIQSDIMYQDVLLVLHIMHMHVCSGIILLGIIMICWERNVVITVIC